MGGKVRSLVLLCGAGPPAPLKYGREEGALQIRCSKTADKFAELNRMHPDSDITVVDACFHVRQEKSPPPPPRNRWLELSLRFEPRKNLGDIHVGFVPPLYTLPGIPVLDTPRNLHGTAPPCVVPEYLHFDGTFALHSVADATYSARE